MKYVDEYRNGSIAQKYVAEIACITTRPWTIIEICGGQAHSIVKYGIDKLLPLEISLIHDSGRPVFLTSINLIDKAIAQQYVIPINILQGIYMCVRQLEAEIAGVFIETPRQWRGIGEIEDTGLKLRDRYSQFDAEGHLQLEDNNISELCDCISGLILQGIKKLWQCETFGKKCTPENPLSAPMRSCEVACAFGHCDRQSLGKLRKMLVQVG